MPKPENRAYYYQLAGQADALAGQLLALRIAREQLAAHHRTLQSGADSFATTKAGVLSKPLTKTIEVSEQFEGKCATSLKSTWTSALTQIGARQKKADSLRAGLQIQLARVDEKIARLSDQQSAIANQMRYL